MKTGVVDWTRDWKAHRHRVLRFAWATKCRDRLEILRKLSVSFQYRASAFNKLFNVLIIRGVQWTFEISASIFLYIASNFPRQNNNAIIHLLLYITSTSIPITCHTLDKRQFWLLKWYRVKILMHLTILDANLKIFWINLKSTYFPMNSLNCNDWKSIFLLINQESSFSIYVCVYIFFNFLFKLILNIWIILVCTLKNDI